MAKTTGLIKIKNGGEVLEINPKTWPQHKALGWELVNPKDMDEGQPAEAAETSTSTTTTTTTRRARKSKGAKEEPASAGEEE